ncbi:MAG TPA: hypothetical protein VGE76_13355, partial [Opitutaceae bacterium]
MKPGRKIVFAGGIAAALLLLWLIQREYGRLAAGRERLRELNRAMAAVQSESARQQAALAAFVPPAQPAASVAPFAAPAQSAAPARARAASRPWLSRLFAESPYLHRLYLEAYRSDLEFAHALTFARLGLTP